MRQPTRRRRRRCLVLTAGMGAGHDAVAGELARRLRAAGCEVLVRDVLTLLPPGAGPALRGFYRFVVRRAPALYGLIHRVFLAPAPGARRRPDVSPLARLAERPLTALVARARPDVVVSTFHLAGQVTGRLRTRGALDVPCAVCVTDFAVHRAWLEPGNDLYLCVTEAAARATRAGTGRPAVAAGPVVPPDFRRADTPGPAARLAAARAAGRPVVLLSAGAWGVGPGLLPAARTLLAAGCLPVLLCGRDEKLRVRANRVPGVLALGWVRDLPGLMAAARVLVDNAAGQTAAQALAAGLPVVGFRPIAGHGAAGVREMAAGGVSVYADGLGELVAAVTALSADGPARDTLVRAGAALFREDAAALALALAQEPAAGT
ncbi:MGDG synthase family glycosyltransferase [Streptomyces sp. ODS05-4]|uniref:MGDG synthase family glycosyltransferase n=1 Tax=Streptomyces sp. ODS05-4 TaxID=2944939 RepID=UPI00210CF1D3|nr:galactosyldiacylglycerol synthase [Streptomyces sp. ODS05-4]